MAISPCGLDCSACDIFRAPEEPEIAQRLNNWFQKNGYPQATPAWFHCCACPPPQDVDRAAAHWSADCEILACVVDQKGLRYCSECSKFACQKLIDWAAHAPKYTEALNRLRDMHQH